MSKVTDLITAMHTAAGETAGTCSAWIEIAQQHNGLLEAFRGVFGKRLPIPTKLGLWLSKRCGETAGELILQGRYSLRKKGWIYRVAPKPKPAPPVEQPALVPLVQPAAADVLPQPVPATHSADYLTSIRYDGQGRSHVEYVRDRDEQPIPARRGPAEPVKAPDPEPASTTQRVNVLPEVAADTRLPAWVREGRQPTTEELATAHLQGTRSGGVHTPARALTAHDLAAMGPGIDFSAGPAGVRMPVDDGGLDGWRYGGPNWTKKL